MRLGKQWVVCIVLILLSLNGFLWAETRHVPSEYVTIQSAVDDCNDGDIVILAPGTYTGPGNRDIEFGGKAITVRSESGPQSCIIDCQGSDEDPHRGFAILVPVDVDANSVIQGLTITGGYMRKSSGGAIICTGSLAIKDCVITGNVAISGAGIASGCYRLFMTVSS